MKPARRGLLTAGLHESCAPRLPHCPGMVANSTRLAARARCARQRGCRTDMVCDVQGTPEPRV